MSSWLEIALENGSQAMQGLRKRGDTYAPQYPSVQELYNQALENYPATPQTFYLSDIAPPTVDESNYLDDYTEYLTPATTYEPERREVQTHIRQDESPSKPLPTSHETLEYQRKEIARELWMLEKHLAQGCKIPKRDGSLVTCDCCEKGAMGITGLSYETIPIAERSGEDSSIFANIATWSHGIEPHVSVPAIDRDNTQLPRFSGEASMLRKQLLGTDRLSALLTNDELQSLRGNGKSAPAIPD